MKRNLVCGLLHLCMGLTLVLAACQKSEFTNTASSESGFKICPLIAISSSLTFNAVSSASLSGFTAFLSSSGTAKQILFQSEQESKNSFGVPTQKSNSSNTQTVVTFLSDAFGDGVSRIEIYSGNILVKSENINFQKAECGVDPVNLSYDL